MLITGFMGSPRKKGNTAFMLDRFLDEARALGAETRKIHVPDLKMKACTGCSLCEKKGYCRFSDDMQEIVYPLLRNSHIIVMASPIYFYTVPAEMKTMIDRGQTLWSRKFKLGLKDPYESKRKGFLLSVGATRGADLFDSINLTMKYYFKGISVDFSGGLTYSRIEAIGEMKKHPSAEKDIRDAVRKLMTGFIEKPSWLFVCADNSLTSQMAAAFAQAKAGESINAFSAGIVPARDIHPLLVPAMEEKGLDLMYRKPSGLLPLTGVIKPRKVVVIGNENIPPDVFPEAEILSWDIPLSSQPDREEIVKIRDIIDHKITDLFAGNSR
jgi:multimeric flavodoxin WrbA